MYKTVGGLIGLIVNGLDVNSLCFNWQINANDAMEAIEM